MPVSLGGMINEAEILGGPSAPPPRPGGQGPHMKLALLRASPWARALSDHPPTHTPRPHTRPTNPCCTAEDTATQAHTPSLHLSPPAPKPRYIRLYLELSAGLLHSGRGSVERGGGVETLTILPSSQMEDQIKTSTKKKVKIKRNSKALLF